MSSQKIILAGTLLSSVPEQVLKDKLIQIRGDLIESVTPIPGAFSPQSVSDRIDVIDARDKIVIPGFINAHCHHTEVLQRSLRDRLPFELWHFERRGIEDILDPGYEELRIANHIALLESLKHGTTSVLHHLSRRRCIDLEEIRACIDSAELIGARVAIAPSVADAGWRREMPAREEPGVAQREIAGLKEALKLIRSGPKNVKAVVGPTSLHTCSDEFLEQCLSIAQGLGIGLHTHFLETRLETLQRSVRDETPVQRASRIGLLKPEVSLAHAVHLSDEELDILGERKPVVVHNPSSNAKLGSGFARIREMLDRGISVALGSDGGDSSDGYSMFDQMKMAAVMRRCDVPDFQSWISAKEAFLMATVGGAKVLGIQSGKIGPDYLADISILKPTIRMWPGCDLVQALVYAENGRSVDTVLVGGKVVLEEGKSVRIDEAELEKQAWQLNQKVQEAKEKWLSQMRSPALIEKYRLIQEEYQEAASAGRTKSGASP